MSKNEPKDFSDQVENSTITKDELSSLRDSIYSTIDSNLVEVKNDIDSGYNKSLEDIRTKVSKVKLIDSDLTSKDKDFLDGLESLYLLSSLREQLKEVISAYKILKGVENGK